MQVSTTVVSMSDCGVRGPRFESHRLVHELHTLTAVPGTVKSVSAFGQWWMWMVVAYVDSQPSCLAWSEGWQASGAESAFIKLTMAVSHDYSIINIVICIICIIIIIIINK